MHVAIQTPPEHTSFEDLRAVWRIADSCGFLAAFTFDHLVPLGVGSRPGNVGSTPRGPQLEGWTTLAALAAETSRLQVGTLVTGITYRHPCIVAKMAVTLDHVTQGRAILGLGAAWHEAEHRMFGIPFPAVGERMGRLDEALELIRRLWVEDEVDFNGRWYQLAGAAFEPKPVRPEGISILVGGSGGRLKSIAARHATMFNSFAAPWEWASLNEDLDVRLARADRRPEALRRTAFVFAELSGDRQREDELVDHVQRSRGGSDEQVRRRVVVGPPEAMITVLSSYAEAGVDTAILNLRAPIATDGLQRFADEVLTSVA